MSLLKLSARLRAHDWTAALIELVIVIVGILIALQVTNWNQDRIDRARGDNYHQRIKIELGEDIRAIDTAVNYWKQVSAYGYAATAHAESGKLVDGSNWKTVLAYYQASQIMPFQLDDTSFVEMRDSGDLALITDEKLRKHLSGYYRLTSGGAVGYLLRHDPVYRVQIRGLTPDSIQEYIWSHCFRQLEGTNQELIDCPSPISEESAAALLESYRGADGLLQNLRYWTSTMRVSSIVLNGAREEAVSLVAGLDVALAR
jgi:hypothetical protein